MRHILAALTLGAALALSTSAAFAYGNNNLDYPGPGLRGSYPGDSSVATPAPQQSVTPSTDSTMAIPWWNQFRQINFGH